MENYLADETSQGAAEDLADQAEDRLRDLRAGDLLGDPALAGGLGTVKPNGSHENTFFNLHQSNNKTNTTTSQYVIETKISVKFIIAFIYQSIKQSNRKLIIIPSLLTNVM